MSVGRGGGVMRQHEVAVVRMKPMRTPWVVCTVTTYFGVCAEPRCGWQRWMCDEIDAERHAQRHRALTAREEGQ